MEGLEFSLIKDKYRQYVVPFIPSPVKDLVIVQTQIALQPNKDVHKLFLLFLQRSEQYLTSSQFFSHFLRQLYGFWQVAQIF